VRRKTFNRRTVSFAEEVWNHLTLIYSSLESPSSRSADGSVEFRQPDSSNLGLNLALLSRVRRRAAARGMYRNESSRQYTPLVRASAGRV